MTQRNQIVFREIANWDPPHRCIILIRKILYSCKTSSKRKYFAIFLFIILSIFLGSLIVCLKSPKQKYICQHIHERTKINIKKSNSRPQSLAIDHFNNDTLFDFVIVKTGLDSIDIFLGQNNGTFQHHTTYSTGSRSQPCSVAVGNLDDQSGVDIVVANFDTNNIIIFMGTNNGFFTFNQSISTGSSHPLMIALADLNNDHWLDLVVLNYGTDSIGVYMTSKDGFFIFSTNYQTGYDSLPKSMAIADLNNDNHLDIVVANSGTNNVGIFFGNGNGTFEDQQIYSTGVGSNPSSIAVGHLDPDDHLDIIIANPGTKSISIFFGGRHAIYSTGMNSHPEYVGVYDFNGDRQLDIIAIDSLNERIYILPGNENGTFPLLSIYLTDFGSSPISMSGADFNNDNKTDALVVNRGTNNILLLMEYDMEISAVYSTFTKDKFSDPASIAMGDLNNDHILDLIVTNSRNNWINIFFGDGNGNFTFISTVSTGTNYGGYDTKARDLNNDGHLDIAIINPDTGSFSILLGRGNGRFSPAMTYPTGALSIPESFAIGDVNNDNCLDIVIVGYFSNTIGIYLGDCNGTFAMFSMYQTKSGSSPSRIVIDDFNNDTHMDLVITYVKYMAISFYYGNGTGRFPVSPVDIGKGLSLWNTIVPGDFNNDHQLDFAASVGVQNTIVIFFGNGNDTFENETSYQLKSCADITSMLANDFNDDSYLDLAFSCPSTNNVGILFGNRHGEFSSQTTYPTMENSYASSLVAGDFNRDNKLDMIIAVPFGNMLGIFMSYYRADFDIQEKYTISFSPQPYSVAVADFNNDSISDLVVVNSGTKNIGIQFGFSNGSFESEIRYSFGPNSFPQYVNVGDLNRDHQVDIVVTDSKNDSIHIFLGDGTGTFESMLTYSMGFQSSPTSVAIANLNEDQWFDLIVTNQGTDSLRILYGYRYTSFVLHQTYSMDKRFYPRSVSVVDIDNDNRLDIVLGNYFAGTIGILFGDGNGSFSISTTYLIGDNCRPRSMTVADMNKDGFVDIITGNVGTESIGILLGDVNHPFTMKTIHPLESNSSSSAIVVNDINNDDRLDVVMADDARGNVDVFLGLGNGSLSFVAACSTGIGSQPNSIAVGDLNNDRYSDIVVANIGTGVVGIFQGYGNGSFTSQTIYPLRKSSRPSSVALYDFDDDHQLDIAVADSLFSYIQILTGFGNGSFSKLKEYSTDSTFFPFGLLVNDFNGDNRLDIVALGAGINAFIILFGTERGELLVGEKYPTSSVFFFKTMASGDLNNDSRLDLVVVNMEDGIIDVFLQNGSKPFATSVSISMGTGSKPCSLAVDDFDHDHRSDIVVTNYGTDDISIILTSDLDASIDAKRYSMGIGSHPSGVVIGHFNDDNHLDIAVINSATDAILLFQGYGNGSFLRQRSYSTGSGSAPRSIAIADLNNDDKMDLVIANAGTNNVLILFGFGNGTLGNMTRYSMGYNSRPYSVAVGDFDRDGWMDMAVANFGADNVEILLQPC